MPETLIVPADRLHAFCVRILTSVGLARGDADTVADVLVTTDTWGVFTHGTKSLRNYVRRLRAGGLGAKARPQVVAEGPAWAVIDGHSALAMVTSVFAMGEAIERARRCGVGFAGVRNSCHFGAAGYYAALAARAGMIGIAMANDTPSVNAPGATGRVTGSNPLAYAIPAGAGPPILLDIATSAVAGGKVAAAHALGQDIPEGWVLDTDGRPTTDPGAFLRGGSLLPMAGHKGYGLALLIEALAGLLTGAGVTWQIVPWIVGDATVPTGHGAAFLALDVAAFGPAALFRQRVEALAAEVRATPASGRVRLPGEIEWERRERALAEGIELPADVVASLASLADDLGLDLAAELG